MAKESERMRQLKENFMSLHQQGCSIREIADKYDLSFSTVYKNLQDIADANNVTRRELLQHEKAPSERTILKLEEKKVHVDVAELQQGFKDAGEIIGFLIEEIDSILQSEQQEENNNDYDK